MPRFHVGTRAKGGGGLLHQVEYRCDRGWTIVGSYDGAPNASFGAYSPRFDLHYLVDESQEGSVGAYRGQAAEWTCLARVASGGECPCYVALHADETCLAVANYQSGSIALFALDPNSGLPLEPPAIYRHAGEGPNPERQEGPHAHCAIFGPNGGTLFHVDLGADQIVAHGFDPRSPALTWHRVAWQAPPGSGPRHLLFHSRLPRALLVSELASTLTLFDVEAGQLAARSTCPTIPPDFTGENIAGHLGLNHQGDRVYVTNRGHDGVAVFALDKNGLELIQTVPSGGASPRFFQLLEDQRLLVLANEEGGNLTAFEILPDGKLSRLPGDCALPGPVFLFLSKD